VQVLDLIDLHHCQTVAFDLTDTGSLTSGMLRLLAAVRRRCALVRLFNASEEICAQLRMAKLTPFFEMHVEDFGKCDVSDADRHSETGLHETCESTA
jgi:hypothetical protein